MDEKRKMIREIDLIKGCKIEHSKETYE